MAGIKKRQSPIRIVVVDDSPTVRGLLVALFQSTADMSVVGTATNGQDAIRIIRRMKPDVITMDIHMPGMGGLEAIRHIMRETPTPIVVVSNSLMHSATNLTFETLQAGALDLVDIPRLNDRQTSMRLVETVRLMADVSVVRRQESREREMPIPAVPPTLIRRPVPPVRLPWPLPVRVIGIAASTGGPGTLAAILKPLPADFPIPILVVQHITVGFGAGLASWLGMTLNLQVKQAGHGDFIRPGTVFLAPDDYHMRLTRLNTLDVLELVHEKPEQGMRPSANYLFRSLAQHYGPGAAGIILTGMGEDGVEGLGDLHNAGGLTIAQDEQSCVVYGMPCKAVEHGAVAQVLSPEQITSALMQLARNVEKAAL